MKIMRMVIGALLLAVAGGTAHGQIVNRVAEVSNSVRARDRQSPATRRSIPAIAKAADGAIVSIVTSDKDGRPIAQGSGFLVTSDGLVITNYHVIADASSAVAKLPDDRSYRVEGVLAFDKARDIAVIKVQGEDFSMLTLGNSDRVQVGEEVVAIGNPLSLDSTVSNGIVSGIRTVEEEGGEYLQITAPISPGSSGGPLFNMAGQVVGITTMYIKGGENLNFAIPVNDAKPLLAESEGPEAAADLSGDYACDVDVIPMHLTLNVSGQVLVLTIHSSNGAEGETRFHRDGHTWIEEGAGDYLYKLGEPTPTFSVTNTMRFFLRNTFVYDKSRGEMYPGAETVGYPPYLTLSGTCKRVPAK
jgi:S1-C subfamily serine protease